MSRLVTIATWSGESRANVVFVHGLGGHAYDTWRRGADDGSFWPIWLAEDITGLCVYSLAYEAPASNWLGTSMPLQDRAVNIFETLLTEPALETGPVVFVCHSLGGLIIKKVLLNLQQQVARRPEAADFLGRVTEIVFAATPHTGSAHATWLGRLRFLAWPSSAARTLVANDPALRDINVAYRGLSDERRSTLRHRIFYETRGTPAGMIVDEASADPGLSGDPPIPIDADHVSIAKPQNRSSLLYARTRQLIELLPPSAAEGGKVELRALPVIRRDQPFNIVPKLIRIAALCLVALIAFKGVQVLIAPPPDLATVQAPLVGQLAEKDRQISKLLALLDDKRTTPAPPGADQELKKAVIAIDEGAKADTRYAQALELLKAGKPAEAEPLLKAVAEDKEESAANANRDAAAAYRNLASIAAVSDPGRAREYFAKAAQLDPDNVEGLYWNGTYQFQAGKLDVAQAAFERVISKAGVADISRIIWARYGLGDILKNKGKLSDALSSYRAGLTVAERLAKADPGNSDWQRDRAVSLEKIGDVQGAQGDLLGALRSYRDRFAVADRLVKFDPGNAEWQRDLSVSFNKIGDVQIARGDLRSGLGSYQDGLAIRDRLAKSDPGNAEWQRDLSVSFNKIGDVQSAQGDLAGALESYKEDFAITDRLARSDPGNAKWQRDLSVSFDRIGNVQTAQRDLPGALRSYRNSFAIRDRLAKSDPGNAGWHRDLSISLNKIGDVQVAQSELPSALRSYLESLAVREQLAKSDPDNAELLRDLSVPFDRIGDVQVAQGDLLSALANYRRGLAIADQLAKSDPGNVVWLRDLSVSFDKIGGVQAAQGDLPGALASYRDSLAIAKRLTKSDPGNAGWQRDLSVSFEKLATVLRKQNEKTKAFDALRQARDIMRRLTALSSENEIWRRDLNRLDQLIEELRR